jgi:hypothetical protein
MPTASAGQERPAMGQRQSAAAKGSGGARRGRRFAPSSRDQQPAFLQGRADPTTPAVIRIDAPAPGPPDGKMPGQLLALCLGQRGESHPRLRRAGEQEIGLGR